MNLYRRLAIIPLLIVSCLINTPILANDPTPLSEEETYALGVEAYQYFYPLITMDLTRRQSTNKPTAEGAIAAPVNTFFHVRSFPDANFKLVVRPNFDTLYSSGWLDLNKEPVILTVPETQGRYYLMPMLDMWTNVFAVPGKRVSGTGEGHFAIVGPNWNGELPSGVEKISAPTSHVWIIGRTQTNGVKDYPAVNKIQDGYKITPLSQWGKPAVPPQFTVDNSIDMKTPPLKQVNSMSAARFFAYASELMATNPPQETDWPLIYRLRRLGIEPGKRFDFDKLDNSIQTTLEKAAVDSLAMMKEKLPTLAKVVNTWQMNTDTMGVYGNYYLKRAIVAMVGLGANLPEDAVYPLSAVDSSGKGYDGRHRYVLHFTRAQLPPANAFWSVTLYDNEGFQVANEINRFAIGDRDDLKYNPDGSLDIYVQAKNPGGEKTSNWLPAPANTPFNLTMRLYSPKPEVLTGKWAPPAARRVN